MQLLTMRITCSVFTFKEGLWKMAAVSAGDPAPLKANIGEESWLSPWPMEPKKNKMQALKDPEIVQVTFWSRDFK